MKKFKIYICGVGGQGIGMLNEILIRACGFAGYPIKGADTHGLAQRGGMVESYLKIGEGNFSPLITRGDADMVVALELHEAMRSMNEYLKDGGTLVYYSISLQPFEVRIHNKGRVTDQMIEEETRRRNIKCFKVFNDRLPDRRFQNIMVIAAICRNKLIHEMQECHYENALKEAIAPSLYNQVFNCFKESI